jgi:hypothetical protein
MTAVIHIRHGSAEGYFSCRPRTRQWDDILLVVLPQRPLVRLQASSSGNSAWRDLHGSTRMTSRNTAPRGSVVSRASEIDVDVHLQQRHASPPPPAGGSAAEKVQPDYTRSARVARSCPGSPASPAAGDPAGSRRPRRTSPCEDALRRRARTSKRFEVLVPSARPCNTCTPRPTERAPNRLARMDKHRGYS